MPSVKVTDFSGITIKPQVSVGEAELKEELKAIQERNAMVVDKKMTQRQKRWRVLLYCELVEKGNALEDTNEGFVFTIGSGQISQIDMKLLV